MSATATSMETPEDRLRRELTEARAVLALVKAALEAEHPALPPVLDGETLGEYTDRLTGADKTGCYPYSEYRGRQCSIGYHEECSDPLGERCKCPCHRAHVLREQAEAAIGLLLAKSQTEEKA